MGLNKTLPVLVLLVAMVLLVGCRPLGTRTPTAEGTADPAPAAVTATVTATAEAAVDPTRSPAPAPTNTPTPSPTPPPPSTSTPTPDPADEVRARVNSVVKAGRLVRFWNDPPTLDPHLTADSTSGAIIVEVFGGLVTITPELDIIPDLARDWDLSEDGRTYTFHLREDALFHDGTPVTAHDVKWSLERAADPLTRSNVADTYLGDIVGVREKLSGEAAEIEGVRVEDDHTIAITIDTPKAYFLAKLTYPTAFVLDKNNVESGADWVQRPNATGPFKLAAYTRGEELLLTKNENYHLGPPRLQEVRFLMGSADAVLMYSGDEVHLLQLGQINVDPFLDPSNPLSQEIKESPPLFSVNYVGMNVNEPPFDDLKVRQAFNYAIDKQFISEALFEGALTVAVGVLPPGFPGYNPDLKGYEYNPELARQLLEDSSYGDQLDELGPIVLTMPGAFGSPPSIQFQVILEMWQQNLGLEVEVLVTEWATYLQDLDKRRFQLFGGLGWIADYPDPENFLDILFHSQSSSNHTGYSNPLVDELLERAREEQRPAGRVELYRLAETVILEDASWVPLWHGGTQYVLVKPYVKDYFLSPINVPVLRYVYLSQD